MNSRPGLSISHLGIFVADLARMEDFYARFLGFTVTDRGQLDGPHGPIDLVFLSRDPGEHHQIALVGGRPAEVNFNVINQISLKADSLATLMEFHRRLAGEKVTEVRPITHGNALSVYFRDPEGNRIELFIDTPWYVDQPMRVPAPFELGEAELMIWAEKHARSLPGFRPREEWRAEMVKRMGLESE